MKGQKTGFLNLSDRLLGVSGDAVARWTSIIISAPAMTMAVFGPIWGMLSDRYGRKLMVMRAMFGGSVLLGLMGFAQTVEHLFILPLLQGVSSARSQRRRRLWIPILMGSRRVERSCSASRRRASC